MGFTTPRVSCFSSKSKWCGWDSLSAWFLISSQRISGGSFPTTPSVWLFSCLASKIIKQVACMCSGGLTSPISCGYSSVVERQPSKLECRRFESDCPLNLIDKYFYDLDSDRETEVCQSYWQTKLLTTTTMDQ